MPVLTHQNTTSIARSKIPSLHQKAASLFDAALSLTYSEMCRSGACSSFLSIPPNGR